MKNVTLSAAEVEVGALLHNTKAGDTIITTLEKMGRPQAAIPMHTGTSTTYNIVNIKVQKNAPKPCICVFIGYKTELLRDITKCFGNLEQLIWPIISPNIVQLIIVSKCD